MLATRAAKEILGLEAERDRLLAIQRADSVKAERDRLKVLVLDHENSLMTFAHDINKLRAALGEATEAINGGDIADALGTISRAYRLFEAALDVVARTNPGKHSLDALRDAL
jgi:hypothetical protein